MAKYSKGLETKQSILKAARSMFYSNGYINTTTRQLADASNTNLGLIKYYFESKSDIAFLIYTDIKESIYKELLNYDFPPDSIYFYLMEQCIELIYILNNESYQRFYHEIMMDIKFKDFIREKSISDLKSIFNGNKDDEEVIFSCIYISSLLPSIVEYIQNDTCIKFDQSTIIAQFLKQLTQYLNNNNDINTCAFITDELNNFYLNIVDNFTPIIAKIK